MSENSRTKNSIINIVVSFLYQFVFVVLSFVARKIFIDILGIELLGVNGLFTNILTVFSLAELGIRKCYSL